MMVADTLGGRALSNEASRRPDLRRLARDGTVHFMGIAGAGMSALADALARGGGRVSGCDIHPEAASVALRAQPVAIQRGHDPAHVDDIVGLVVTAAVPADHPEIEAARRRGIPVMKRADALASFVERGRVIAIAGTHGKTTTSAMTAAILSEAGLNPTAFVGGNVPEWDGGLRVGSDDLFVVEADEYDRSFLTLRARIALVTAVEADHLDVYGSAEHVEAAFDQFVAAVPADGLVVACTDDDGARRVLERCKRPTLGYGLGPTAALRAHIVDGRGVATRFAIWESGRELGRMTLAVPGLHNVRNALGAFAAAREAGADLPSAQRALGEFRGVGRRFQELGRAHGVIVIDDYAHHPTEIRATLDAARACFPGHRVVAVFQPHLYSRTRDFALAFGQALSGADAAWVTEVYPAREEPIPGVSGAIIAQGAQGALRFEPDLGHLCEQLSAALRNGDVCIFMGAGDIDRTARALLTILEDAEGLER